MENKVAQVVKNLPASAGDTTDTGSIPGSGRSPGGGHGDPVFLPRRSQGQSSQLATVHGVAKSQMQLSKHNSNKGHGEEDLDLTRAGAQAPGIVSAES